MLSVNENQEPDKGLRWYVPHVACYNGMRACQRMKCMGLSHLPMPEGEVLPLICQSSRDLGDAKQAGRCYSPFLY